VSPSRGGICVAVSIDVNMPPILTLVNIDICRYDARMTRSLDPDIRLLAALADPARLEIVRELAGSAEVCACDLTSCCDVSQPTVSHHLKVLREAGAVVSDRRGSFVYYRVAPDLIDRLGGIARGLVPGGLVRVEPRRPAAKPSTTTSSAVSPAN
jgi:ArsR family transcriptional regulator, arsenate/arsenite/antimonite-responsive transcriptional repressor